MKQPFPLEAVPTAELPEGAAAALEPGHSTGAGGQQGQRGNHRNIFLRPTLTTLGLGLAFFGWFVGVFFPPGSLPSNIIFVQRISGRDRSFSWLHFGQRSSVHAWGARSGDQASALQGSPGVLGALPPPTPPAPPHPLLALDSHGKKQKNQLSPTSASKEGLKEQEPTRIKVCSLWLARERSKDSPNTENLTVKWGLSSIPPSPCQLRAQSAYSSKLPPSKGS